MRLSLFPHSALSPSTPPAVSMSRLGLYKKLGGDTAGQLIQIDQRDIPCHVMSCSAVKLRQKKKMSFFFFLPCWPLLSKLCLEEVGSHCLCNVLVEFVVVLSFTFSGVFILTHKFSCICSSCSVPWPTGVCMGLVWWQGSTHSTWLLLKPSHDWSMSNCKLICKGRSQVQPPCLWIEGQATTRAAITLKWSILFSTTCGDGEVRTKVTFCCWRLSAQSSGIKPSWIALSLKQTMRFSLQRNEECLPLSLFTTFYNFSAPAETVWIGFCSKPFALSDIL